jgi:hypothetical protein
MRVVKKILASLGPPCGRLAQNRNTVAPTWRHRKNAVEMQGGLPIRPRLRYLVSGDPKDTKIAFCRWEGFVHNV